MPFKHMEKHRAKEKKKHSFVVVESAAVDDVDVLRLLGMLSLSLPQLSENVGQFLTLPLGTDVCAQATLQELEGALILGHLQQFHGALLVGSMANHLAYQIAGELGVAGLNL